MSLDIPPWIGMPLNYSTRNTVGKTNNKRTAGPLFFLPTLPFQQMSLDIPPWIGMLLSCSIHIVGKSQNLCQTYYSTWSNFSREVKGFGLNGSSDRELRHSFKGLDVAGTKAYEE
jgi:hypothetical protein